MTKMTIANITWGNIDWQLELLDYKLPDGLNLHSSLTVDNRNIVNLSAGLVVNGVLVISKSVEDDFNMVDGITVVGELCRAYTGDTDLFDTSRITVIGSETTMAYSDKPYGGNYVGYTTNHILRYD